MRKIESLIGPKQDTLNAGPQHGNKKFARFPIEAYYRDLNWTKPLMRDPDMKLGGDKKNQTKETHFERDYYTKL